MSKSLSKKGAITNDELTNLAVRYNPAAYAARYAKLPDPDPFTGIHPAYNFNKFPFMMGLYADSFPNIVIQKAVQVGASEYSILRAIHACDMLRCHVMYGFPHSRQVGRFSRTRVDTAIKRSDRFRKITREISNKKDNPQNTHLKTVNGRFFHLVGVASDAEIQSESVDLVIRDERDLMDQDNAEVVLHRNDASTKKINIDLGFPTIEGFGISEDFANSDMREYEVRCDSCGEWQEVKWPRNVDKDKMIRICYRCGQSIERAITDFSSGRWIPKSPERSHIKHGYHIHKLIYPGVDMHQFLAASQNMIRAKEFHNFWLGIPYTSKDIQITEKMINDCTDASGRLGVSSKDSHVYCGVDVGAVLHCWTEIIDPKKDKQSKRMVDVQIFSGHDKFEKLGAYISKVQPVVLGIDTYPEISEVKKLVKRFLPTVWAVAFQDFTQSPQEEARLDLDNFMIKLNRTMILDWNAEDFSEARVTLPGEAFAKHPDIKDHFKAVMRVTETIGSKGIPINRWVTPKSKPDHWVFARAACLAAAKLQDWLVKAGGQNNSSQPSGGEFDDYDQYRKRLR